MTRGGPNDSDAVLAARAVKGDRSAFNHIVRRHQQPLYRFIRRYVGDADEAYDLLQETFVSAWLALGRYDSARPASTWLRRIALNKCRDWGRRRTVRRFFYGAAPLEAADVASNASTESGSDEAAIARLDRAIALLPPQMKEPLLLTAFEGMSQEAAGKALGITAKAVETRVYRARKLLAEALAANGADEDEDPRGP
ncbi:MAG: RNA polymerase sigma factor [Alphaproteobacteria bacterium]|nr:RNA polymerase sigma factor [Alphaproteobacteria bacterium]